MYTNSNHMDWEWHISMDWKNVDAATPWPQRWHRISFFILYSGGIYLYILYKYRSVTTRTTACASCNAKGVCSTCLHPHACTQTGFVPELTQSPSPHGADWTTQRSRAWLRERPLWKEVRGTSRLDERAPTGSDLESACYLHCTASEKLRTSAHNG